MAIDSEKKNYIEKITVVNDMARLPKRFFSLSPSLSLSQFYCFTLNASLSEESTRILRYALDPFCYAFANFADFF